MADILQDETSSGYSRICSICRTNYPVNIQGQCECITYRDRQLDRQAIKEEYDEEYGRETRQRQST